MFPSSDLYKIYNVPVNTFMTVKLVSFASGHRGPVQDAAANEHS